MNCCRGISSSNVVLSCLMFLIASFPARAINRQELQLDFSGQIESRCESILTPNGTEFNLSNQSSVTLGISINCNDPLKSTSISIKSDNGGIRHESGEITIPYEFAMTIDNLQDKTSTSGELLNTVTYSDFFFWLSVTGNITVSLLEPLVYAGAYEDKITITLAYN